MHDLVKRNNLPELRENVRVNSRLVRALALSLKLGCALAAGCGLAVESLAAGTPMTPVVPTTSAAPPSPTARATAVRPRLSLRADGLSFGLASAAAFGVRTIATERRKVSPAGLDRSAIRWGWDRRSIHTLDAGSMRWSDRCVTATLALPTVLALALAPGHPDARGLAARFVLFAEASLLTDVVTTGLKASVARPRPVLYHDPWDGSSSPSGWNFESMPSGHASRSWCAASFALVDHLYSRPGAGVGEDATVGLAAGILAGATAALRVRGGVHFPSDVLAGAGIGVVCGAGVPLLHAYRVNGRRVRAPTRRRWLVAAGGVAAGAFVGIGVAQIAGGS